MLYPNRASCGEPKGITKIPLILGSQFVSSDSVHKSHEAGAFLHGVGDCLACSATKVPARVSEDTFLQKNDFAHPKAEPQAWHGWGCASEVPQFLMGVITKATHISER